MLALSTFSAPHIVPSDSPSFVSSVLFQTWQHVCLALVTDCFLCKECICYLWPWHSTLSVCIVNRDQIVSLEICPKRRRADWRYVFIHFVLEPDFSSSHLPILSMFSMSTTSSSLCWLLYAFLVVFNWSFPGLFVMDSECDRCGDRCGGEGDGAGWRGRTNCSAGCRNRRYFPSPTSGGGVWIHLSDLEMYFASDFSIHSLSLSLQYLSGPYFYVFSSGFQHVWAWLLSDELVFL